MDPVTTFESALPAFDAELTSAQRGEAVFVVDSSSNVAVLAAICHESGVAAIQTMVESGSNVGRTLEFSLSILHATAQSRVFACASVLQVTAERGVAEIELTTERGERLGYGRVACAVIEDETVFEAGDSSRFAIDIGEFVRHVGRSRYTGFSLKDGQVSEGRALARCLGADFESFAPGMMSSLCVAALRGRAQTRTVELSLSYLESPAVDLAEVTVEACLWGRRQDDSLVLRAGISKGDRLLVHGRVVLARNRAARL